MRRLLVLAAAAFGVGLLVRWPVLPLVPLPASLFVPPPPAVELQDRNGMPLRAIRPADDDRFGEPVAYAAIPRALIEATLIAEDRRYWKHPGVDWRALLRAAWQCVVNRRIVSGGSTITQQLIKIAEPRPRNLRTKAIEAVQALRLEQVWDKQRILAEYLNRVEYGNCTRGCAAAARFYFAKPLPDLSPAECAFLAGLPQAPSRLNPRSHFERAKKRQEWILAGMRRAGRLTPAEWSQAIAEPICLAARRRPFEAPHFVDLLLALDHSGSGGRALRAGAAAHVPAAIRTSLDLELNRVSERILRRHLALVHGRRIGNGAVVVLDNRTGEVLALVGSEDYFGPAAGQVNGAWARRSAGSTLKPFLYWLAFERGDNPATVVADVPSQFATPTGLFAPANYNGCCVGPVRYRLALANSLNIAAVKVLASIGGPAPLCDRLRRCGISTVDRPVEEYGLGLAIGNAEVRLLELANAYGCLARLGRYRPWQLIAARPGLQHAAAIPAGDETAAYLVADILSDNDARALAFGAESPLRFSYPVACKTGTSSDFRDNWAFGYTPEFTVGVWVGNPDGSPMRRVSGVSGAGPVLHEVFEFLHEHCGTTWFTAPAGVIECRIHPITGKRLNDTNAAPERGAVNEIFMAKWPPPPEAPGDYIPGTDRRVVRLPAEYGDWLKGAENWLGDSAAIDPADCGPAIVFPPPGTRVFLDGALPGGGSRLVLRATGSTKIEWRSDTLEIVSAGGCSIATLAEGRHRLWARDRATGREARTWVEVSSR